MTKRPRLNRAWHQANRMPPNATFEQRVAWHREHLKHCACRAGIPAALADEMRRRGMAVPGSSETSGS